MKPADAFHHLLHGIPCCILREVPDLLDAVVELSSRDHFHDKVEGLFALIGLVELYDVRFIAHGNLCSPHQADLSLHILLVGDLLANGLYGSQCAICFVHSQLDSTEGPCTKDLLEFELCQHCGFFMLIMEDIKRQWLLHQLLYLVVEVLSQLHELLHLVSKLASLLHIHGNVSHLPLQPLYFLNCCNLNMKDLMLQSEVAFGVVDIFS
mmetsp:Transcript_23540/g.54374  ORF Transcript_23540/g.54374 Transcript_23540/m.54374 type:complete len:209 (-) Transcript_23540:941-1567(-)